MKKILIIWLACSVNICIIESLKCYHCNAHGKKCDNTNEHVTCNVTTRGPRVCFTMKQTSDQRVIGEFKGCVPELYVAYLCSSIKDKARIKNWHYNCRHCKSDLCNSVQIEVVSAFLPFWISLLVRLLA